MSLFDNIFKDQSSNIQPQAGVTTEEPAASSKINPIMQQDISVMSHLDARSTQIISQSYEEAKKSKVALIEPEELLLALLSDRDVFKLLQDNSIDVAKVTRETQAKLTMGTFTGEPTLSEASKQILEQAYTSAKQRNVEFVTPEDILMTLVASGSNASLPFQAQGLDKAKIEEKLAKDPEFKSGKKSALKEFGKDITEEAAQGKLDPVAGREIETRRLIHILLRRTKNNPLIIGEAGTGKTAIVEGLAQLIVQKQVPPELLNRRIISIEVSTLVAGASHRGEFEERLQRVIKETLEAKGGVILFFDEIHTIIGAGETGGALDASNILKPYLARGQIQVIGTTTTAEYRRYFEKDKAFQRRFQTIVAEEPSEELAVKMLQVLQPKLEAFHKITFAPEALTSAVKLSKRYIGERFLPDKAIDLLDEAGSEIRMQQAQGKRADTQVKEADIQNIVSAMTGIPISKLTEKEGEKLLHLEELIHKKYVDHDRAVKAVAEAVRRGRIGLANLNRPIASFIFLGPTGTGKTEIAKILAEIMFGKADNMIRLDMSEYMEKHEVAKLIGAPPGYVGYEEGGQLTEAVRKKPYSIVLLDEIEKAHPDVFNILLQLLEDGRLTDNKGNTVSFKNTIVIATSNVGSNLIRDFIEKTQQLKVAMPATQASPNPAIAASQANVNQLESAIAAVTGTTPAQPGQNQVLTDGLATVTHTVSPIAPNQAATSDVSARSFNTTPDKRQDSLIADKGGNSQEDQNFRKLSKIVLDELNKHFRPEFLNRFDEIVIFEPLTQKDMAEIAKLGVESTRKMLKDQGVELQVSEAALAQLAKDGYDPVYGARPLRRLIQRSIENPVAIYLISKTLMAGDIAIVDYDPKQDKFSFNKARNPNYNPADNLHKADQAAGQANSDQVSPNPNQPPVVQPAGVANNQVQPPMTQSSTTPQPLTPIDQMNFQAANFDGPDNTR